MASNSLVACRHLYIAHFRSLDRYVRAYAIYVAGAIWLTISSILCGVSQTWLMLIICRALQGLALAALLPSGITILGSTYRPGPRKNLVFSVYGACAALGFFAGFFFSGVCSEFTTWRWYFFVGAILSAITAVSSIFSIPRDYSEKRSWGIRMDWIGLGLSVPVLHSSCFLSQKARLRLKGIFTYVEGWVISNPLLHGDIFRVKYMTPLTIALLCLYGSLGIFLLYGVFYMSEIMGATPLQIVAWTVPMAVGGLILSATGGFILHKVSGTLLLLISCLGYVGSGLLFALIPVGGNYWAYVFPSMICGTIAIDISFNLANIFITTSVPKARQGRRTAHLGPRKSYKAVFWFETGLAGFGLLLVIFFVRIRHAKSFKDPLFEIRLSYEDLPRPADPVAISSIPSTGTRVPLVRAPVPSLSSKEIIIVKPRLQMGVYPDLVLRRKRCIRGEMHKGKRRDVPAPFLHQASVGLFKPIHDTDIHPVRLRDELPVGVQLLEV
ncbi:hypothetical protein N7470_001566 [Penicillium chermesinum]|nr:hypothetical protein N7470_001566 [Penicillium chermesinum]